ncbi:MAG: AAA-like domain-containing protein [Ardenticatenaceae bacterium]
MDKNTIPSDFFVAGGALKPGTPSYVERPADEELLRLALRGEFCYVLTPRQMGKSSLMSRTAALLRDQGVQTVIIDVTRIGTATVEQWYLSLLTRLQRQLYLTVDARAWWKERADLGAVLRFTDFMYDIMLTEIDTQIVIFIDEIDATLKFDFRDDFFAAIRAMYNARANDPAFNRLTFILLGVASPPDLIKDSALTPFNIGQGIILKEFSPREAIILQEGLETIYPAQAQAQAIFTRIYHWSSGYPYLTQKLCLAIAESKEKDWRDQQIDALVEELFFSDAAEKDSNIKFVQDKILNSPQRRQLLNQYKKVYQGQQVADDGQSIIHNELKLSGLVKKEGEYLQTRNRIYRQVFDLAWVKANTAIDWTPVVATIAVFIVLLLSGSIAYDFWVGNKVQNTIGHFYEARMPSQKATHLATLFRLEGLFSQTEYDHKATQLFYSNLSGEEQLALFDAHHAHRVPDSDMITLIQGLYTTLADVEGNNSNQPLLEAMKSALDKLDQTAETTALRDEINHWLQARDLLQQGESTQALNQYDNAFAFKSNNPATLYERAKVLTNLSRYEDALRDLELVIAIARTLSVPPTPTPAPGTTPSEAVPTITLTSIPTPNVTITPTEQLSTPAPTTSNDATATTEVTLRSLPAQTPIPAAMPILPPFRSDFDTRTKMIGVVRNLIQSNPELNGALATAPTSQYSSLRDVVPPPTATSSPTIEIKTTQQSSPTRPVVIVVSASGTPISRPTNSPTSLPTNSPISLPTNTPISLPTDSPISRPTNTPISPPINTPTSRPTNSPISRPTKSPISPPVAINIGDYVRLREVEGYTGLNLRDAPSLESTIIQGLEPGSLLEVVESGPDLWWRVRSPFTGQEGWITSLFDGQNFVEPIALSIPPAIQIGSYVRIAEVEGYSSLSLRQSPSTDSSIIESLPFGTVAEVISGPQRLWWEVRLPDGQEGWVVTHSFEGALNLEPTNSPISLPTPIPSLTNTPISPPSPVIVGEYILFVRRDVDTDGSGDINWKDNGAIYRMKLDGSEQRALTEYSYSSESPSWSPDGRQIVFTSNRDGDFEIYIMERDGFNWQQLTNNEGLDHGPDWSPSGQWIVFYSDRSGKTQIYRMHPDGTDIIQLTDNGKDNRFPTWSPDEQRVAWILEESTNTWSIYLMNVDGTNQRAITSSGSYSLGTATWSPNGRFLAYAKGSNQVNIYIYDFNTNSETQITTDHESEPDWSPDGSQIIYARWEPQDPQIWIMSADGTNQRRLTNSAGYDTQPVWSP